MHALITGASSGIGEATARYFAELGWDLSLVARREDRLQKIADDHNVRTWVQHADLGVYERCAEVVKECEAKQGPIDVLINNAGILYVEPTVNVEPMRIKRIMTVNLIVPMTLIHHVLPSMLKRGRGTLVNISSVAGVTPTPGMCHYNASKAGLAAASESLRVELKSTGVHVLTVYPGPVSTAMQRAAKAGYQDNAIVRSMPVGDADVLAKLIHKSIVIKKPRLFYPKVYTLHRYARLFNQWFTDRFIPPLRQQSDLSTYQSK
jgi:short-subunit dehydrogenase